MYSSQLFESLLLHELNHIFGLKDTPGSRTIMDPIHLPYYLSEEDIGEARKRIRKFLNLEKK